MLTQFYLTKNQHAKINNKSIDNNYYDLHGANRLDTLLLFDFTDHGPPGPLHPPPVLHVDAPHHEPGLGGAGAGVWGAGVLQPGPGHGGEVVPPDEDSLPGNLAAADLGPRGQPGAVILGRGSPEDAVILQLLLQRGRDAPAPLQGSQLLDDVILARPLERFGRQ